MKETKSIDGDDKHCQAIAYSDFVRSCRLLPNGRYRKVLVYGYRYVSTLNLQLKSEAYSNQKALEVLERISHAGPISHQ